MESQLREYSPSDVRHDTLYTPRTVDTVPEPIGGMRDLLKKVEYPERAKRKGISGEVLIGLIVRPGGGTSHVQVVESVDPLLDREAKRVVKQARFEPGLKSGTAVPVKMLLPISFKARTSTQQP